MFIQKLAIALGTAGVLGLCVPANGQEFWTAPDSWQGQMDLLTAGAAASVVGYHLCYGEAGSQKAASVASQRLGSMTQQLSATGASSAVIWDYARDAYEIKVKAMLAANEGVACSGLGRLRALAVGTGFPAPD